MLAPYLISRRREHRHRLAAPASPPKGFREAPPHVGRRRPCTVADIIERCRAAQVTPDTPIYHLFRRHEHAMKGH